MFKKIMYIAYISLWMLVITALGVYYLAFAPRQSEYSPEENRMLTGFPETTVESVLSGEFGTEIESYFLDHFPGRNTVISAMSQLESAVSMATHNEYLEIAEDIEDPLDTEDYQENMEELLAEIGSNSEEDSPGEYISPTDAEYPPIENKPEAFVEDYPSRLGMYMDVGEGEYEMQGYSRSGVVAVTAVLNKYAQLLPQNGKLLFTMGPSSYLVNKFVNSEEKLAFYNTWDEVINGLSNDNVYAFDSCEILSEAIMKGEYVAFRTDNHWTPYGAYIVYSQMAERAGKAVCSYSGDFDKTVEEFRGTYYRDNPTSYRNVEPDVLELLMPKISVEYRQLTGPDEYEVIDFLDFDANPNDRYTVYLGGPGGPWRYVECDNNETENCLVITDSFGMTMIPFLTSNYKQVHYYDARYFSRVTLGCTVSEMIEKYDIHDIYVVVANFHTFSSGFLMTKANNQLYG